jgi:RNA polymerase sigma-70 factor, ECF subfamily
MHLMATPPPERQGSPDAEFEHGPGEPDEPKNSQEEAQPHQEGGVRESMGSLAIARNGFQGAQQGAPIPNSRVEWAQLSDADIMLRVREGDDTGFSILIEKYRKQIVHFMFRMSRNQAVAEELAQEVFLRVYRSRQTYRAEAKFSTWLYRIATNLAVNHARDTKYERTAQNVYLDQPDPESGTTPDVADKALGAEQELVRDERMAAIRKHVMALPERQRTAVLMHKYQEMDYKEIGAVLKLSESATKSLLFRAYQTLRENLKDFAQD